VAFTDSIVHVPEGLDPSLAYSMRMAASHFSFAYVEGERFFAAVEAARGPEGVAAVWADPPLEPALIGEPGWYLDPSTRVSFRYDIEGFFRTLGEELGEQGWSCQQIPLLPAQLAVAFSLLPPEDARVVLARLLQARLVMASPLDDPTGGVQIGLMEMATPGSAEALFVLEQRLLVAKDEAMRGTAIEILSAEYEHFELDGERALLSAKTLSAYGQELEVQSLIAVRGTLVLELNHVGTLVEREVLEAEARRYLAPPAVAVSEPSGESPAEELPVDGD
jgi:hypothetical protein